MGIIKGSPLQLGTISNAVKGLNKVVEAGTIDDPFAKWERIISGINTMAENFMRLRTGQIIDAPGAAPSTVRPALATSPRPQVIANSEKTGDNTVFGLGKWLPIIHYLTSHLERCANANPAMTLGEAITKIDDINVTQLLAFIRQFTGGKNG